jgi:hypothetical protein
MRRMVTVLTVSLLIGVMTPGIGEAGTSSGPTGNAQTIDFYRQVVATTISKASEIDTFGHLYALTDDYVTAGLHSSFALSWGGRLPRDYVWATAAETVRSTRSQVNWVWWHFTPTCGASVCVSSVTPLQIFATKSGAFWGYQNHAAAVSCWVSASGSTAWIRSDFRAGEPWETYGFFYPMVAHGPKVLVTSKYPYARGVAVETDTIVKATKLFSSSVVRTHPHESGFGSDTYTIAVSYPQQPPGPPKIKLCKG